MYTNINVDNYGWPLIRIISESFEYTERDLEAIYIDWYITYIVIGEKMVVLFSEKNGIADNLKWFNNQEWFAYKFRKIAILPNVNLYIDNHTTGSIASLCES